MGARSKKRPRGLGGLGLRTAKMLVEGGASGIMLSSRSGLVSGHAVDAEKSTALYVVACDVGDAADALALLARAVPTGVLHAAGVLHDKIKRFIILAMLPKAEGISIERKATNTHVNDFMPMQRKRRGKRWISWILPLISSAFPAISLDIVVGPK